MQSVRMIDNDYDINGNLYLHEMSEINLSEPLMRWNKYYTIGFYYLEDNMDSLQDIMVKNLFMETIEPGELKNPNEMSFEERIDFFKSYFVAGCEAKKYINTNSPNPGLDTANTALDMFHMLLTVLIQNFIMNRNYPCPETFENNIHLKGAIDLMLNIIALNV